MQLKIYWVLLVFGFLTIIAVGPFALLMGEGAETAMIVTAAFLILFLSLAFWGGIMEQRFNGSRSWPETWQDILILPFLIALWEPFSRKNTHWWHWKHFTQEVPSHYLTPPQKDPTAKDRSKNRWSALWQTNFGWREVVVLSPKIASEFKIGFWCPEDKRPGKDRMLCSVVVKNGVAACLVGPKPIQFFAITNDGFTRLTVIERMRKKDLPKHIMLL